ncbi:hypothetical protein Tco_0438958 [Tanacetum coccineum]
MYLSSSQNPNHDPIDVLVLMQNLLLLDFGLCRVIASGTLQNHSKHLRSLLTDTTHEVSSSDINNSRQVSVVEEEITWSGNVDNGLKTSAASELEDLLDRDLELGPAAYLYGLHGSFLQAIDEYEDNNNVEEKKGTTVRDKPYIVRSQELFVTGVMTRVKSLAKDAIRLQKEDLAAWVSPKDCLVLATTGSALVVFARKLLCFQILPLLTRKVVVVISPLISLIHDQCLKLARHGVSICFLESRQVDQSVEQKALRGMYEIIYLKSILEALGRKARDLGLIWGEMGQECNFSGSRLSF